MTLNETPYSINKAVVDYLVANWSYTSVNKPNSGTSPSLPYIEPHFKPGQMMGIEIQGAAVRPGVFMINIFTPLGVGTDQGNSYGGKLEELFWHKQIGDVVCENGSMMPYTNEIGKDEARQAWHHQTVIPFSVITEDS